MRTRSLTISMSAALAVLASPPGGLARLAHAQAGPTEAATPMVAAAAPAVGLGDVVTGLLANNTEVKLAGVEAELARGSLLAAEEPFDAVLGASATGSQDHRFDLAPDGPTQVRRLDFTTGVSKRLRAGVVIAPEVSTARTMIDGRPGSTVATASARLRVLVPLLRDLGGVLTEGPAETARRFQAGSLLEASHATSVGILQAASAYWDYLAAQRRLEVFAASEARAERTARETSALVKADERTRTDRVQAEGHLAASRASRISAEQDVVAAWESLATIMGVAGGEVLSPPPAGTDFPAAGQSPTAGSLQRWLAAAWSIRDDLRASRIRVEGSAVAGRAARSELLPRLDLELSAGYKGEERDRGWDRFLAPLHQDVPGLDAQVGLRFELPVPRSGATGRVTQAAALEQRHKLLAAHVERAIRNGVAASSEGVRRSQQALAQSQEAVRLLEQTVESERQKFRLGFSTLFAVIQAEEQLTTALLSRIANQRSFAVALARLRYETGTLLTAAGADASPSSGAAVAAGLLLLP